MPPSLHKIPEDSVLAELSAGFQPVQAFDQYEPISVGAHWIGVCKPTSKMFAASSSTAAGLSVALRATGT
jgi:hypothetical protein